MHSRRIHPVALVLLALGVAWPALSPATIATRYATAIHPWQPVFVERELNGPALDMVNLTWGDLGAHPPVRLTWYRAEDGVVRATSDEQALNPNSVIVGTIALTPSSLPTVFVFTPTGGSTNALLGFSSPGAGGPGPGFLDRAPAWTISIPAMLGFPEFYVLNVEAGPELEILVRFPPVDGRPPDNLVVYSHLGLPMQTLDLMNLDGVGTNITLDFADMEGDGRYEILVHSTNEATLGAQLIVLGSGLPTAVEATGGLARLAMSGPAPNPVGRRSTISYSIPRAGHVRVRVFDAAGRHVRTLADGFVRAGEYAHDWDGESDQGRRLPPGMYLLQVEAGSERTSRKAVLLR